MPVTLAQHSKATVRWGTPSDIVERARRVLCGIGLDPFSEVGFQNVVRADRWLGPGSPWGHDGFARGWHSDAVFLNPPGGSVVDAWDKLTQEILADNVTRAVWVGFSLEQLAQLAEKQLHPLDFVTVIPRHRIHFTRHDGYDGAPSHSNYITGILVDPEDFAREFGDMGKIVRGSLSG